MALQAPLPVKFSRQEYWSGLPFPSPGDLPKPGMEPMSPAFRKILYYLSHQGIPTDEEGSLHAMATVHRASTECQALCKQTPIISKMVEVRNSASQI